MRSGVAIALLVVVVAACSSASEPTDADGTWVGTITTEGNVTTVVNESGSVWGGTATLVEETSIGVEIGDDEYMFGQTNSIYFNAEHIVVVDNVATIVRMYDHEGNFIRNLGGAGQGPGEYTYPMVTSIGADGGIFVLDVRSRRVNVYGADGESLDTWFIPQVACCAWPMFPGLDGGSLWMPIEERNRETRETRTGVQAYGPDGPLGETLWVPEIKFEPITYEFDGRRFNVPLGARLRWGPMPSGDVFVGANDRYRFEVHRRDGTVFVIEKYWEPIPIDPEHREWQRRAVVASRRAREPGWNWDGAQIPTHFMPYASIVPTLSGEIWVGRHTASRWLGDCTSDPLDSYTGEQSLTPCWTFEWTIDVFDEEGRFLGEVEVPQDILPYQLGLYIDGDAAIGNVRDLLGTTRVKRYRLVLPGEQ